MNLYAVIGSAVGTDGALSLGVRLSAWHDAMVTHERQLRSSRRHHGCDDECPHVEASALWTEALAMFGARAHELTFLRARGNDRGPRHALPAGSTAMPATGHEKAVPL